MENYDFVSKNAFEFEIKNLEEITQKKAEHTSVPHRANFYQIVILNSGQTTVEVDFRKIGLIENQILFVAKNQVVRFETNHQYSGKIILFTELFYKRSDMDAFLLKETNLFNPFHGNVVIELTPKIQKLIDLLEEETNLRKFKYQEVFLYHLLNVFFIEASQHVDQSIKRPNDEDHSIVQSFSELVEMQFKVHSKVNAYLQLMPITAKRLASALKRITGKTAKQFLEDRITLEAKRLLVYSNKSIKEIGYELGFDEPTNFSKFFRNQTSKSPAVFKADYPS